MAGTSRKRDFRREQILQKLHEEGRVYVAQLSELLNASPVTIREDLSAMERDGQIIRVHGGAMAVNAVDAVAMSRMEEKVSIGEAIAQWIHDGDTVFVNSGTTTLCVANALKIRKNLNIVTNSLDVAEELSGVPTFRVVLLGGEINVTYSFTYGGDAQEMLSRYQADWAILSVEGISVRGGITTHHAEEAVVDRMMIDGARRVLIAADHSKLGRVGFAKVCDRPENARLVTDSAAQSSDIQMLECAGWKVKITNLL